MCIKSAHYFHQKKCYLGTKYCSLVAPLQIGGSNRREPHFFLLTKLKLFSLTYIFLQNHVFFSICCFSNKDDKYIFKACNSCCAGSIFSLNIFLSFLNRPNLVIIYISNLKILQILV